MTSTVKYYWPERQKGALKELTRVLEMAEERVTRAQQRVSRLRCEIDLAVERLEETRRQQDECRLALEAAKRFDPEAMYRV